MSDQPTGESQPAQPTGEAAPARPLVSIRGDASPDEVAALVAVVQALAAAQSGPAPRRRRSVWADPGRQMHRPLHPAPDGWKRSGLPR